MVDMSILNFDNFSVEKIKQRKYRNKNALFPQHIFRMLITGNSGCGKTNCAMDFILRKVIFDKIYIYSKHLEQHKYKQLIAFFRKIEEKTGEDIVFTGTTIDEIVPIEELDEEEQNLIIFDDFLTEKDQTDITNLFIRGRHKNASIIYLSQSYFRTPRDIRLNCNYYVFFEIPNRREVSMLYGELGLDLEKENFVDIYRKATKDPFSFLFIDRKTLLPQLRYRKNLNGILIEG